MKRSRMIWLLAFVVFFGSTSVVLFSSSGSNQDRGAGALTERLKEFWDCRIKGDYVTIYDLMSPDIRESVTRAAFVGAKGFVNYYSYDLREIEIDGDEATAMVQYTWKANHPLFAKSDPKEHLMEDQWVRVDGKWYKKFVSPTVVQQENGEQPLPNADLQ